MAEAPRYGNQLIAALLFIVILLVAGMLFFHVSEGWGFIDSFYFTGITLSTVGFGDLTPTHDLSKVIAVIFSLLGISVVFYAASLIARRTVDGESKHIQRFVDWSIKHATHELKTLEHEEDEELKAAMAATASSPVSSPAQAPAPAPEVQQMPPVQMQPAPSPAQPVVPASPVPVQAVAAAPRAAATPARPRKKRAVRKKAKKKTTKRKKVVKRRR